MGIETGTTMVEGFSAKKCGAKPTSVTQRPSKDGGFIKGAKGNSKRKRR